MVAEELTSGVAIGRVREYKPERLIAPVEHLIKVWVFPSLVVDLNVR